MKKYRKKISLITLSLYVTFLSIAIFHHHIYDLGNLHTVSDVVNSQNNAVKDPFLDDQSNCRLVQFSHAQYSSFTQDTSKLLFLPQIKDISLSKSTQDFESLTVSSNQLRAPPVS